MSDWRFYGDPHFLRGDSRARRGRHRVSLLCFWAIRQASTFRGAQKIDAGLGMVTAVGVALLVSSHSNLALFVVLLLPSIFYLVVPTSFRWT